MSKKLICLFLALMMLLTVCLASCSEEEDDDTTDTTAYTLAMYLMSEKPVDDTTAKQITDAVNAITETKFKTRLKLYFYTEAEYYEKLDAAFAARDEAKKNGTIAADKQENAETNNDNGVTVYPSIAPYQVDIFYMGGKANYDKYKAKGMLSKLNDELSTNSQAIKTTVSNQYLTAINSLNKGTYAIPTSKAIGEYTYLLLNKKALEADYRRNANGSNDYSTYTSLTAADVQDFLKSVSDPDGELCNDYYPIYTNLSESELLINNLKYWGVDENGELSEAFSVLGGYYNNKQDYLDVNAYAKIENLFENTQFINDITVLKNYQFSGYYNADENKDFAVGYVKGGAELAEIYGDEYELVPIETPRLSEEELYSDLFAVCSYSRSVSRSMEIITFMNTDEQFRNLLLYGVEETHYEFEPFMELNEKGELVPVRDEYDQIIYGVEVLEEGEKYVMDPNKTGNTLLVYPGIEGSYTLKDFIVKQNQDAKIKLDLGFALSDSVDGDKLENVRALSASILEAYLACENETELAEFIESARAQIAASEDVAYVLNAEESGSLITCYNKWLKDKKIVK